jgi:hypothetical protein
VQRSAQGCRAEINSKISLYTAENIALRKELLDLDDDYKKGYLSKKEYKEARKYLMKGYNN